MGASLAAGSLRLAILYVGTSVLAGLTPAIRTHTHHDPACLRRAQCIALRTRTEAFAFLHVRSTQIPKSGKLGAKVILSHHSAYMLSIVIGRIVCYFASVTRVLASVMIDVHAHPPPSPPPSPHRSF